MILYILYHIEGLWGTNQQVQSPGLAEAEGASKDQGFAFELGEWASVVPSAKGSLKLGRYC